MTEHSKEWGQLRVGATVTLRDWRGDSVTGEAFLSPGGGWLANMKSGTGHVFPIVPRELIKVVNGADETWARLQDGRVVTFIDWNGDKVTGIAQCNRAGLWECKTADGARWLLEPYRIAAVEEPAHV